MILVSSGVCYGNPAPEYLPVTENCPLRPNNPYSASKGGGRSAGRPALPGARHRRRDGPTVQPRRPAAVAVIRPERTGAAGGRGRGRAEAPGRGRQPRRRPRLHRRPRRRPRLWPARRARSRRRSLQPRLGPGDPPGRRARGRSAALAQTPITVFVDPARVRPVDQPLLVADPSKLKAATGWEPRFPIAQTLADMLQYWRDAVACRV